MWSARVGIKPLVGLHLHGAYLRFRRLTMKALIAVLVVVGTLAGVVAVYSQPAESACCCSPSATRVGDKARCKVCGSTACRKQEGCTGKKDTHCESEKCGCKT